MAKAEWGTKRTCQNCGARFYDLHRDPIVCPTCQTTYDPERQTRSRRSTTSVRPEPATIPANRAAESEETPGIAGAEDESGETEVEEAEGTDEVEDLEEMESEDEEVIEDTSDLGEDDDDIGEVIEHIENDVEDKT